MTRPSLYDLGQSIKRLSVRGHKLTLEWSGEYGENSSSTGYCSCGAFEESCSNQTEVRKEYRNHLLRTKANFLAQSLGYSDFNGLRREAPDEEFDDFRRLLRS